MPSTDEVSNREMLPGRSHFMAPKERHRRLFAKRARRRRLQIRDTRAGVLSVLAIPHFLQNAINSTR